MAWLARPESFWLHMMANLTPRRKHNIVACEFHQTSKSCGEVERLEDVESSEAWFRKVPTAATDILG